MAAAARTVLVADDTTYVRDRFRGALERAGHQVLVSDRAASLFALADAHTVDVALVDLQLPGGRGVELIRALRGRAKPPTVLVFSGTITDASEVRQLAQLGVAGYLNEYCADHHIVPCLAPHLFPDSFNRRTSPRVTTSVPVQYRVDARIAAAVTLNVSHGGMAIRSTSPFPVGTVMHLRFRVAGGTTDIEAQGRVAWSDDRVGMGVQFESVDSAGQAALDQFVDAHFFTNRKA